MTEAASNMTLSTYMAQMEKQQAPEAEKEDTMKENKGTGSLSRMGQADFLVDEELDISEFEIVSPEFFSQIKEPSFTVNVNKVYVNAACVRMLPDVEYVRILVNRKRKQVVFEPSDEMDIKAYRWSRDKDGKRYASQRTGNVFVMMLCEMMGWDPDYRYKIIGRLMRSWGHSLIVFDLTTYNCYPKAASEDNKSEGRRKTAFPLDKWNGRFGPTYAESKRSIQVNTFDEYTVWTIKEGEGVQSESAQEEQVPAEGGVSE